MEGRPRRATAEAARKRGFGNANDNFKVKRNKTNIGSYNWNEAKVEQMRKIWNVNRPETVKTYVEQQAQKLKVNRNDIINSVIKHGDNINKTGFKTIFARLGSGAALFPSAPAAIAGSNANRLKSYVASAAFDEFLRKYTPSLRQAHSGSLFEQAAVAVAAQVAGKLAVQYKDFGNNVNTRNRWTGDRLTRILTDPRYSSQLRNGVFVLKSVFGLNRIKTSENISYLQKLFTNLVKQNSINSGVAKKIKGVGTTYNLTNSVGKSADISLWKGFYEVEPDVLYFKLGDDGVLYIHIFEFKIGSGKSEQEPAEYFQLVKAKRTIEMIFDNLIASASPNSNLGRLQFIVKIHFFPLKYRLQANSKTDFTHPKNTEKWRGYWEKLSKPQPWMRHGPYSLDNDPAPGSNRSLNGVTTPSDFERITGVSAELLNVFLDAKAQSNANRIRRETRTLARRRAIRPGAAPHAAALAATGMMTPAEIRNLLSIAGGAQSGTNYIASMIRQGRNVGKEFEDALKYLHVAGYGLKRRNGSNTTIRTMNNVLHIGNAPENSRNTLAAVKARDPSAIPMLIRRVKAAENASRRAKTNATFARAVGGRHIEFINKLAPYTIVPLPGSQAPSENEEVQSRNATHILNNLVRTPRNKEAFQAEYLKFVRRHANLSNSLEQRLRALPYNANAQTKLGYKSEVNQFLARGAVRRQGF
jgi:hypothetical protein